MTSSSLNMIKSYGDLLLDLRCDIAREFEQRKVGEFVTIQKVEIVVTIPIDGDPFDVMTSRILDRIASIVSAIYADNVEKCEVEHWFPAMKPRFYTIECKGRRVYTVRVNVIDNYTIEVRCRW